MADVADFASTSGQILFVLQTSGAPMNANDIYRAGSFDYEHTCYNGLAQLSKKGVLHRERVDGLYQYVIAPGADLSDWEDELKEMRATGLPEPDPQRRMPVARAEYESKSREEKREIKRTRSVVFRETAITETEEPAESRPEVTQNIPEIIPSLPPAPVVAAPPMLTVAQTVKPYEKLLAEAVERRDAVNREIALIQMMGDITSNDGGWLAFALQDYCDLLKLSYDCMDDDLAAPLHENERRAREYLANLKNGDKTAFRRAAHQLLQWAFLNEDAHAGPGHDGQAEAFADAAESRKLAALFGVDSEPGEMPK